jgi:hypothetical protein
MTPIEWNDSEPGFPDHLPPLPPVLHINDTECRARLQGVLKAAGIKIWFCGSMDVTFPDGATFADDGLIIEADGYSR